MSKKIAKALISIDEITAATFPDSPYEILANLQDLGLIESFALKKDYVVIHYEMGVELAFFRVLDADDKTTA